MLTFCKIVGSVHSVHIIKFFARWFSVTNSFLPHTFCLNMSSSDIPNKLSEFVDIYKFYDIITKNNQKSG